MLITNTIFIFSFMMFQEQALSTIKLTGRNDLVIDPLNKQAQLSQTKAKETNGHLSKV